MDQHAAAGRLDQHRLVGRGLDQRRVAFLAYNSQTETAVTARVRDGAEKAGVVVVDLTETLPDGVDYTTWMGGIVDQVTRALADAAPEADGAH